MRAVRGAGLPPAACVCFLAESPPPVYIIPLFARNCSWYSS